MAALTASLGPSTLGLCKTLKRTATDPVGGGHHETAIRFEDENAAIVEPSYPAAQRKAPPVRQGYPSQTLDRDLFSRQPRLRHRLQLYPLRFRPCLWLCLRCLQLSVSHRQ